MLPPVGSHGIRFPILLSTNKFRDENKANLGESAGRYETGWAIE